MKLLLTGMPVSPAVAATAATAHVCAWDRVATGASLTRTRAFADVPVGEWGIPTSGPSGSRPGGTPAPQRPVDLVPSRPRPSGGQPQD
jgi:hypothetical protein